MKRQREITPTKGNERDDGRGEIKRQGRDRVIIERDGAMLHTRGCIGGVGKRKRGNEERESGVSDR
jgi:hypothetical protein